jgi:tRNA1Val (adenine37-N6)-methyltransferase
MSNPYFRFKQFTIHQDRSVMKVCTDSCILGAWSAGHIHGSRRILDIGTGTGLLPLMLAQRSPARIDAIEWDPMSCAQAQENIRASPWSERILVTQADVRTYSFPAQYDFIISNPPFFESDLRSPDHKKNQAKHDESLTLEELLEIISKNLLSTGKFSVLLPIHRTDYFEKLAFTKGFFAELKLFVRQTPTHSPFRSISLYSMRKQKNLMIDNLTIKNDSGKNSREFCELMNEYYGG